MRRGSLIAYIRVHPTLDQPMVPAGWDVVQESSRWSSVYPLGRAARPDVMFHARLMIRRTGFSPHRALFVCSGAPAVLSELTARVASDGLPWTLTWADLPALRADATPAVVTLRSEWPDERRAGDAGAIVRLLSRMAGWDGDDAEGGPAA